MFNCMFESNHQHMSQEIDGEPCMPGVETNLAELLLTAAHSRPEGPTKNGDLTKKYDGIMGNFMNNTHTYMCIHIYVYVYICIYIYVYTINGIYCNGDIVYIIIWMNYNDLSVTSQYHLNILETLFHLLRVARVTTKKITAVGNLF